VLARLLMPDEFGTFFLALSIIELIYILGSWSFSTAIIRAKEIKQAFLDTAYWLLLALGGMLFLIILAGSFLLKTFYSHEILKIMVVLSAIKIPTLLSACYSATVERNLGYKKVSMVQLVGRATPMLAAVAFAVLGFGVWTFVGRSIVESFLIFFGMRMISPWNFQRNFSASSARYLMGFGAKMLMSRGLEIFIHRLPQLVIGSVIGTVGLGYYGQANILAELGHRFGGPVNIVSLAAYSRLQDSREKRSKAFKMINYFLIRISVIVAVLFLLFGKEIVVFLYGEKWQAAGEVLRFFSLYTLFVTLFKDLQHFLYSQGEILKAVKMRGFQVIFLAAGMLLIPYYGIKGAALTMGSVYLTGTVLGYAYVKQYVNVDFKRLLIPAVLTGAVLSTFLLLIRNFTPQFKMEGYMVIPAVIIVTLIYIAILYFIEREQVRQGIRYLLTAIRR